MRTSWWSCVPLIPLLASLAAAPASAADDAYPTHAIRLVVPYPPGGSLDVIARVVGERMSAELGQPLVVENRSGASGAIGTQSVARSAADGYTLLMGSPTPISILPNISTDIQYDPAKDLVPVGAIASGPHILAVNGKIPAHNVKEFVEYAKRQPNPIPMGTFLGSPQDLAGYLFARDTGIQLQRISYRGTAPAVNDLLAGTIQFMVVELVNALPYLESGRLNALGIASPQRNPVVPNMPTIAEQGLPGFESSGWFGLFAPAGTPEPIVAKLAAATITAVGDPGVRDKLAKIGVATASGTRADFVAHVKAESAKWRVAAKEFNIKASE